MKLEDYKEMRNALVTEAEGFINEGKFEESTAKQAEIVALDNQFETAQKELVNLNALKEQENVFLENKSIAKEDLTIMENKFETGLSQEKVMENAFAKTMLGLPLSATEQANVAYAEDNAVLIPQTTMDEIIGLVAQEYPFFGDARKENVRGVMKVLKHKGIKSGDAAFYAEKTETALEENEFVEVMLTGKEIAKAIEISWKLDAMSVPAFMSYIKNELVARISDLIGNKVHTGNGTTEFKGVFTELTGTERAISYQAGAKLSYELMTQAMAKLGSQFVSGSAIYVSQTTLWTGLAQILDENGKPIFIASAIEGGVGRMFGLPVKVDGGVPEGSLVLGNANKGYIINTNQALTLDSDKDITKRKNIFAAYALMDGIVRDERALVVVHPEN